MASSQCPLGVLSLWITRFGIRRSCAIHRLLRHLRVSEPNSFVGETEPECESCLSLTEGRASFGLHDLRGPPHGL